MSFRKEIALPMELLRTIEAKFLYLFALIFKIQSNWFFEIVAIIVSAGIISFLIWAVINIRRHNKSTSYDGFKKISQTIYFYGTLVLTLIFVLLMIIHLALVTYIALSPYKLSDFNFDDSELEQELTNIEIYDSNGNKVYTIVNNGINREMASINEMPKYLQDAFVDIEDKRFYQHAGVSILGYVRAVYNKVLHPSESMHGGSTITQQLIKNVNEDMYNRNVLHKYQEALVSILIENKYSKKEILEMYMNRIYLGKGVYGVGTAAKQYFGKNVSDVSLAESAFLAGLPQAPSAYTEDIELGNKRKNTVLYAMKENQSITEAQYQKAIQENVALTGTSQSQSTTMDAYIDYVLKEAKEQYGVSEKELKSEGYRIYTYLNTSFQTTMYQSAEQFSYQDDQNAQGAKVQPGIAAIDNNKGKIIALYGGKNYVRGNLNRAYSYYQPGSTLKPLAVYTPAFETGKWTAQSEVKDEPINFNGYTPKNAGEKYEGTITLERALIRSANIPAVSVLQSIGVAKGAETLEKMGITVTEKDRELHLALGGMEKGATPIQMAQAYAVFPNYGHFEEAEAIKYIKDNKGNFLERKTEDASSGTDVFSPESAYHMTEMLQKVISSDNGTGKNANIGRPLAGKTGTSEMDGTTGNRDAWFIGFTPDITMAVHLSFDKPSETLYLNTSGGDEPARLFSSIMKQALANTPAKEFTKPNGVESISALNKLKRVEHVDGKYDKKAKAVTLTWDKQVSTSTITYKVYKKVKDGDDVLLATTTENTFSEPNTLYKDPYVPLPKGGEWYEILFAILKNIGIFFKNLMVEKHTYYVIATNENEVTEASNDESVYVRKIKLEEATQE